MVLIADIFANLCTTKSVAREMSKTCRFTVPFNKQPGKRAQTLLKSEGRPLYHIYRSLRRQLSLEKSLIVIFKILRLFVKTSLPMTRDLFLTQPIQMQLSVKQKTVSTFFLHF